MFLTCGQNAGVTVNFLSSHIPRALPKILSKITFESDAPRLSKMNPGPSKSNPKSIKIEPGDLQLVFPMLFCRTLVLNDNCMNFKIAHALGHPRIIKKPSKPSPRNILKLYVAIAASKP